MMLTLFLVCFVLAEMELENKSDILFIALGLTLCTRLMCHSGTTSRFLDFVVFIFPE